MKRNCYSETVIVTSDSEGMTQLVHAPLAQPSKPQPAQPHVEIRSATLEQPKTNHLLTELPIPSEIPSYLRRPGIKPRAVRLVVYFSGAQAWPVTIRRAKFNAG